MRSAPDSQSGLLVKQFPVGPMQNFCYIIGDRTSGQALVVDPAWEPEKILKEVKKEGFLTGQHPFVVFNALRNAERFPYSTLLELQSNLLEIDRQLKSSVSDPHLLLENFLIKACSKAL